VAVAETGAPRCAAAPAGEAVIRIDRMATDAAVSAEPARGRERKDMAVSHIVVVQRNAAGLGCTRSAHLLAGPISPTGFEAYSRPGQGLGEDLPAGTMWPGVLVQSPASLGFCPGYQVSCVADAGLDESRALAGRKVGQVVVARQLA